MGAWTIGNAVSKKLRIRNLTNLTNLSILPNLTYRVIDRSALPE